jgi:endo-1,4-beta-xylanase
MILFSNSNFAQETKGNQNQDINNVSSLFQVYQAYFPIGAAIDLNDLKNSKIKKTLEKHFNSITAENDMKPERLLGQHGKYTWGNADKIVHFAKTNQMQVRGHTLIWHKQTPDWFFQDNNGDDLTKEKLYERLENYMTNVLNHFKYVETWDVVNEAVNNNRKTAELYRQEKSKWYEICNEEFVEKAFIMARKIAPGKKLFYNDYGLIQTHKRNKTYTMLKNLLDKGVPIDGIGIQAHWNIYDNLEDIENTIKLFASLGLEIHITELDISMFKHGDKSISKDFKFTDELEIKQAHFYKEIFEIFRKHKDHIGSVSLWGVHDKGSWLNNFPVKGRRNYPLLFDDSCDPKKSFIAITKNIQ